MRKFISILIATSLLLSLFVMPSYATNALNARWVTISDTVIYHQYNAGNAECFIYISGQPGAQITSVDVQLVMFTSAGTIQVATWNDLSGGNDFTFAEYVPVNQLGTVYQLSFTATVVRNGVTETISDYLDVLYT